MYITIAYSILAALAIFFAFHTNKVKRVSNIILFVIAGTFALMRFITGDHSVTYPIATVKAMYAQIISLNQNQLILTLIGAAVLTVLTVIIGCFQMKIIRDRG